VNNNTADTRDVKVAFLGLGRMGLQMAGRLVATGHDPVVWNRSLERADLVTGARVATSAAEAATDADVVITMLADAAAVEAVFDQISDHLRPGTVLIDMSSIGPDAIGSLAAKLPLGVALVDAPVLGSTPAARDGDLVILAGGAAEDVDRVRPFLDEFGSVRYCGELGSGAALKVVVISAVIGAVTQIAEVLDLSAKLGIARETTLAALGAGPLAGIVGRATSTDADFPIRLAAKDLALALAAAEDTGLPQLRAARGRLLAADDPEADLSKTLPQRRHLT
jgi:3-hydroxyisobutyrate dehydrogenase